MEIISALCSRRSTSETTQAPAQCRIAPERAEISEQLAGAGEQHGVACNKSLVGDVLCEHGFADAVGRGQHNVGCIIEKVERHQRFDGGTVAFFGQLQSKSRSGLNRPMRAVPRRRSRLRRERSCSSQPSSVVTQSWSSTSPNAPAVRANAAHRRGPAAYPG